LLDKFLFTASESTAAIQTSFQTTDTARHK